MERRHWKLLPLSWPHVCPMCALFLATAAVTAANIRPLAKERVQVGMERWRAEGLISTGGGGRQEACKSDHLGRDSGSLYAPSKGASDHFCSGIGSGDLLQLHDHLEEGSPVHAPLHIRVLLRTEGVM